MIIEGICFTMFVGQDNLEVGRAWGIQNFVFSAVLLALDGGIIFLPLSIKSFFRTSLQGSSQRSIFRNPLLLMNLPKRKAVALLFIINFAISFLLGLNSYLGGPRESYLIFNTSILAWIVLAFVCQLLMADMPMSVLDLLRLSSEENFGLVMSRKSLISELRKASEKIKSSQSPFMGDIELSILTFVASQARIELSLVISYRWSDETLYLKKNSSNSLAPSPAIRLKHSSCAGFDWTVVIMQSQLDALLKDLTSAKEPYVWMDQFSIPQVNSNANTHDLHETRKQEARAVLVPKMTGLYSCASRVAILNNSGDDQLMEEDWYQNRLWCMQEYCFASQASIHPLVSSASELVLRERMNTVGSRWFGSSSNHECLDIILDWMESDPELLDSKVEERVQKIGSLEYLELVGKKVASNTNDTLSALAQPWFGVIMTSDITKAMFVRHVVADALRNGMQEIEVISNPPVDSLSSRFSGSMAVDRMLSRTGMGVECGPPVEVRPL
jgi:hypothetical protein